jgi:hypothetical protein
MLEELFNISSVVWPGVSIPKFIATLCVTSFCESTVLYPFDLIITRLQVHQQHQPFARAFFEKAWTIFKTQGIASLYRGIFFNNFSSVPVSGLYFASYNSSLRYLESSSWLKNCIPTPFLPALAGGIAEICVQALWVPQDVIVQRLQICDKNMKGGAAGVAVEIYREGGVRNFYRGLGPSLLTCVPGGMISWTVYEYTKRSEIFLPFVRTDSPVDMVDCISGALAGGTTATAMNPFDVCKTRIQTNVGTYGFNTTFAVLRHVAAREGGRALYNGLFGRLFVAVPASIASSISYECTIYFSRDSHDLL